MKLEKKLRLYTLFIIYKTLETATIAESLGDVDSIAESMTDKKRGVVAEFIEKHGYITISESLKDDRKKRVLMDFYHLAVIASFTTDHKGFLIDIVRKVSEDIIPSALKHAKKIIEEFNEYQESQ